MIGRPSPMSDHMRGSKRKKPIEPPGTGIVGEVFFIRLHEIFATAALSPAAGTRNFGHCYTNTKPMAKTASKSATREPRKTTRTSRSHVPSIEEASEEALKKLQTLGIEAGLQNDLEWCLGSYRADGNPVGLYTMVERAIQVFRNEQGKKTKGITAKLVKDLEKSLKGRQS